MRATPSARSPPRPAHMDGRVGQRCGWSTLRLADTFIRKQANSKQYSHHVAPHHAVGGHVHNHLHERPLVTAATFKKATNRRG